jgi:hypothetical protein
LDFSESGKPLRKIGKPLETNRKAIGERGKPLKKVRKPLKKAEAVEESRKPIWVNRILCEENQF